MIRVIKWNIGNKGATPDARMNAQLAMQVFSVFRVQKRACQLELVVSICWLIGQKQSTDLNILYNGLESWPTPKRQVQHKANYLPNRKRKQTFS